MVGKLKFQIKSQIADSVVAVKAFINEEICRERVSPLPADLPGVSGRVDEQLRYVLVAPIYDKDKTAVWDTVDFDTNTDKGEALLSNEVSDAAMFHLAAHLRLFLTFPGAELTFTGDHRAVSP